MAKIKKTTAERPRVHFAPAYLQNPVHRIGVDLVGAGGNGSQMLSALARIDHALRSLGRQGLHVAVWDRDTVEEPNVGRQLFSPAEIGMNKAVALAERFNRFYGLDWEGVPENYTPGESYAGTDRRYPSPRPNILVTCVDNADLRIKAGRWFTGPATRREAVTYPALDERSPMYWLDLGNERTTGQAILGSVRIEQPATTKWDCADVLPTVTEEFRLSRSKDRSGEPSCSMAEALRRQDLFVNSSLVQLSGSLLWRLLKDGFTQWRGFYLDTEGLTAMPIPV